MRPFDADANGTLFGEGGGIVVLKRLSEAIRDGDNIYAVIKGSAVNNDGSQKVGYTAPGVAGQADVVKLAQGMADISAGEITYLEAHGTGTQVGDPIELAALTQVFRESTDKKNFCALGSVKANIGHLDVAAGIAGLIKAALCIKNRKIPPQINYSVPNPGLDIEASPFFINTILRDWHPGVAGRRIAGVSSFGMGALMPM